MDFWDLTKLIGRRWFVSVPLLILASVATVLVAVQVQPDYVATSYVQLVPPSVTPKANNDTKATARNPWLDLGLASLAKAGVISVQDQRVVTQLQGSGLSDDFTLTQDTQLPIVTFEVIGNNRQQATQTSEQLIKRFSDSVLTLQREYGAPSEQMITARRLDLGDNVKQSTSKVKRALIAVGVVGIMLAVATTVALDAWLRRRSRRRAEAAAAAAGPGPQGEEPASRGGDAKPAGEPAASPAPRIPAPTGDPGTANRRTVVSSEYRSQSAYVGPPSDETVVILKVPPLDEGTIVIPPGGRTTHNGSANGSKHP